MNPTRSLVALALCCATSLAQTVIFPPDYVAVPEGPFNAPNLPLAYGTSRVQCLYESAYMSVPAGHQITSVGFREDTSVGALSMGRSLQLEVRMGYSDKNSSNITATFDSNFTTTPVTVFGPALFVLPNLRDPASPLANGRFSIPIAPFTYAPAAGQNLLVEYRVFGTSGGGSPFNYYMDRADFYSPVVNGPAGCPHTTGTPSLTLDPTRPGYNFGATVTQGPSATLGVLAINIGTGLVAPFSLQPLFSGIAPTCTGQVSPLGLATIGITTGGSGYANISWYIPNNPVFSGIPIGSQALLLDFFSPGGLVVSNGCEVLTGTIPRSSYVYANAPPTSVVTGSRILNYCPVTFFQHN